MVQFSEISSSVKEVGILNDLVLKWLEKVTVSGEFDEPIVEFGALQVEGQKGFADLRRFFPGKDYLGCDLVKGAGVDRLENLEFSRFAPNSIGTVLALETFEHVQHPWEAVKEIYRILKPGGSVLISIPFHFPVHFFPDDYWRMTTSGLEALLKTAGFTEITVSDSGEDIEWDIYWDRPGKRPEGTAEPLTETFPFPFMVFAKAVKPDSEKGGAEGSAGRGAAVQTPVIKEVIPEERFTGKVPIIMVLYHREQDTRDVLLQLERVTDNYELILVDNGFDDTDFIHGLNPASYIRNDDNVGIIRAINQGLDAADGKYLAVVHSDLLIYEDGWLDHIIEFMEHRPDIGLVGLAGRHGLNEDGSLDEETLVCILPEYGYAFRPSWRFTEIAVVDGICWVMRNHGFRLDESLSRLHYYDMDISMQYLAAGYRVYNANIEFNHLREKYIRYSGEKAASMTSGVSIDEYYLEARARFREKWSHMLPISRGFMEEQYVYHRIEELLDRVSALEEYIRRVDEENQARGEEIERAKEYVSRLERELDNAADESRNRAEQLERAQGFVSSLEDELARAHGVQASPLVAGSSRLEKLRFYLRTEGAGATFGRAVRKLMSRRG